ncbi:endonuclease [Azoarcus sp. DD4]|uniref:restriction endonuclease n=1 Tax=Azoarcus sp. DD4 TaxID=2027405 RepID=UPI00112BAB42|nr:restriction endonuclease [Azoarcus sp. DD4]QDF96070.1 endonuclease [Azoarcus sp. DD4]
MARRRYRRREGWLTVALRADWKFSAVLAAVALLGATAILPALLGGSPLLRPLAMMLVPLAYLFALLFGATALLRYYAGRGEGGRSTAAATAMPRQEPSAREPDELDKALASVFPPPPPSPPRPQAWSAEVLDRVEWKRFEDLCCEFYREKGIRAETTRLGADGGVDIRLFQDETDPGRVTAIVQCKAHSRQVGVKPVRELRGVMAHEKVEKAFFMAPRGYTEEARAFAAANRITLLDGRLFLAMLQRLPEPSRRRLLAFATEGDWTTPTCPSCGGRMTVRDGKRGAFWGCVAYPQCRGLLPMRTN